LRQAWSWPGAQLRPHSCQTGDSMRDAHMRGPVACTHVRASGSHARYKSARSHCTLTQFSDASVALAPWATQPSRPRPRRASRRRCWRCRRRARCRQAAACCRAASRRHRPRAPAATRPPTRLQRRLHAPRAHCWSAQGTFTPEQRYGEEEAQDGGEMVRREDDADCCKVLAAGVRLHTWACTVHPYDPDLSLPNPVSARLLRGDQPAAVAAA